jgi:hypothetical protein
MPYPVVALTPLVCDQSPRLLAAVFLNRLAEVQLAPRWPGAATAVVLNPLASSRVGSVKPRPSISAWEPTATLPFWTWVQYGVVGAVTPAGLTASVPVPEVLLRAVRMSA